MEIGHGVVPAVVAFAVVGRERVVDALAGAGRLLAALGRARAAEVERVGEDAQETNQAVQLTHPVLHAMQVPEIFRLKMYRFAKQCYI